MVSDLQQLVDGCAEQIGRTVTIDDRRWRVAAYSRLYGDLDRLRLDALLQRDLPAAAKSWVDELRLADARAPVRTPPNPAIGAEARLVIPIRHEGALLGYLTLMDPDATLSAADIETARACAAEAARLIFREELVGAMADRRERELLDDLLSEDESLRRRAATALREETTVTTEPAAAFVLVGLGSEPEARERGHGALTRGLAWLHHHTRRGSAFGRVHANVLQTLIAAPSMDAVETLGRRLLGEVQRHHPRARAFAGVGGRLTDPESARRCLRQATGAATVAARLPRFDAFASWERLGSYALLTRLKVDGTEPLHPALDGLRRADRAGILLATLETYLDNAGDVKATAEALSLHRAGVYYRLSRVQELTGLDVQRDGEARLALHLAVKLERLTGDRE